MLYVLSMIEWVHNLRTCYCSVQAMHCHCYFSDRDKANIHWVERLIDTNTLQAHVVHKYRDYYFLCGFSASLAIFILFFHDEGECFQSINYHLAFKKCCCSFCTFCLVKKFVYTERLRCEQHKTEFCIRSWECEERQPIFFGQWRCYIIIEQLPQSENVSLLGLRTH